MEKQTKEQILAEQDENNAKLMKAYGNFKKMKVAQPLLDEFCSRNGLDYIDAGEYEDFVYELEFDGKIAKMLPELLVILGQVQPVSSLESREKQKKAVANNDAVIVEVRTLFERYEIPYRLLDNLKSLGVSIATIVNTACEQISNCAGRVYNDLAEMQFSTEDVTVNMFRDYANENLDDLQEDTEDEEEVSEVVSDETAEKQKEKEEKPEPEKEEK